MEVQDVFETAADVPFVAVAEGETDNVFKAAMRKLDGYFLPKLNEAYEHHVFRQLKQEEETVAQFVSRLKQQAINCEFGDLDAANKQIRVQVVDACKSSQLCRKLLQKGTDLTLDNVLSVARAMEAVDLQMKRIEGKPAEVNRLSDRKQEKKWGKPSGKPSGKTCFCCGKEGHIAKDSDCPAKNATCNKCKFFGHYAVVCKTKSNRKPGEKPGRGQENGDKRDKKRKPVHFVGTATEDDEYSFTLYQGAESNKGVIDVKVGGVFVRVLIDSGSTANVIDSATWKYLKKQCVKCVSEPTAKRLYPYVSSEPLN
ncbi:uncharacterized protein LOC135493592 [Lineus longissimus]|uniref:uncharacterized protein LOC135493592 n=1 Tax=Lineus longissimus TaxID=88925 RepID=UPI00315CDD03